MPIIIQLHVKGYHASTSPENFFKKKVMESEREAKEREQRIKDYEEKEAELLEKIKATQNLQMQEFNKLEEVMFEQ